jgi:hypothetical protein
MTWTGMTNAQEARYDTIVGIRLIIEHVPYGERAAERILRKLEAMRGSNSVTESDVTLLLAVEEYVRAEAAEYADHQAK